MWFMYVLRCSDNALYAGITNDINRRLREHNNAGAKSSKCTRSRLPVRLVYKEKHLTRSAALKRENQIKLWSKARKEALITG
ncbi:MAG: GIY-YIG nuclease family protein [Candidatus Omnitrophota bacterium]|nr:GIY-YIG nuclease family protein [Candidatus Omnitrophota bacterium]